MLGISNQHLIPRLVAQQYWLSCLVAFAVFIAGFLVANWKQQTQMAEANCLVRLERAASLVRLCELRESRAELEAYFANIAHEPWFSYAAVVSQLGVIDAHSNKRLVGTTASEPIGFPMKNLADDKYVGIRWHNKGETATREYRRPAGKSGDDGPQVRLAMKEPSFFQASQGLLDQFRYIVVAPLIVVLVGGIWIRRSLQPMRIIQQQLRNAAVAPEISSLKLHRIDTENAGSLGWNRMVDYVVQLRQQRPIQKILDAQGKTNSKSELVGILNSLSDGIAITDSNGKIQDWNTSFASLVGFGENGGDLGGQSIHELLTANALGGDAKKFRDADGMRRIIVDEIISNLGNNECYFRLARHPLGDGDGHVWTIRDITQQKLTDRMRDQFLDSATHELRTPLANIKAYAETLSSNEDVNIELQKEFCNTIDAEATRLARFIDELLDVSSLEAGSMTIQKKNTELDRLLSTLIEHSRPLMETKNISFDVELPEKLPEIKIDKDKIATSLVNLLGNAAKYTPEGGDVVFRVSCEDEWIEFEIEDSGVGIAENDLAHVFDKFFRSSDPSVQQETGTGLGLPLAKQVFELHGGTVTATSTIGEGSIFTARLPLTTAKYYQEA